MKYLFLGGSKDGETMEVPGDRWDVQVIKTEPRSWSPSLTPLTELDYEVETYTRKKLRGEAETFEVFTLSNWTGDMLMRHLLHRATNGASS